MTKISQDTVMGIAIVLASLMLLVREQWFLSNTQKGRKLVEWFGAGTAVWVLRGTLTATAILGGLLAGGIVRPIQWGSHDRRRHCFDRMALASRAAFATPSSSSDSAA